MPYYTPLRYPGGKRRLAPFVQQLLDANQLTDIEYVEPYAGGAAVALSLLFEERARRVHINDLNPAVHAFWHAVLHHNDAMRERVKSTKLNMAEWRRHRKVLSENRNPKSLDLGFAAFYLNRTNRSGILSGGVIGGKAQQGEWNLAARFNRDELELRIAKIGRYRNRISLTNEDALQLAKRLLPTLGSRSFTFFDPPYIENGEDLYLNLYKLEDHRELAREIANLSGHWMVSYDSAAARHNLFPKHRQLSYDLPYSAQKRYHGQEALFLSPSLKLPKGWTTSRQIEMTRPGNRHPLLAALAK